MIDRIILTETCDETNIEPKRKSSLRSRLLGDNSIISGASTKSTTNSKDTVWTFTKFGRMHKGVPRHESSGVVAKKRTQNADCRGAASKMDGEHEKKPREERPGCDQDLPLNPFRIREIVGNQTRERLERIRIDRDGSRLPTACVYCRRRS
jgi:hypothetical protein